MPVAAAQFDNYVYRFGIKRGQFRGERGLPDGIARGDVRRSGGMGKIFRQNGKIFLDRIDGIVGEINRIKTLPRISRMTRIRKHPL